MISRITLVLILVLIPKITKPQSVSTLMGSRSASLGNASSTLSDSWSLLNNPSGLAQLKLPTVGFAYSLNPNLPGADRIALALSAPFGIGVAGLGVFKFGDELYNEQLISAGYANRFGLAALGVKLSYVQYRAEGFETKSALSINFGGIAKITPNVSAGAYIVNLNRPKLSSISDERLPVKLITGVQLHPENNLLLLLEVEKDLNFKPTFKAGIEYEFYEKIDVRTGFNLEPNSVHGGIGYKTSRLQVNYAMQYSPSINSTYQISTSYKFQQRNQ